MGSRLITEAEVRAAVGDGKLAISPNTIVTPAARDLARRSSIEMPIVEEVYRILYEDGSPQDSLERLLSRPVGPETGRPGSYP